MSEHTDLPPEMEEATLNLAMIIAKSPLHNVAVIQTFLAAMAVRAPDMRIKLSFDCRPRQKSKSKNA